MILHFRCTCQKGCTSEAQVMAPSPRNTMMLHVLSCGREGVEFSRADALALAEAILEQFGGPLTKLANHAERARESALVPVHAIGDHDG